MTTTHTDTLPEPLSKRAKRWSKAAADSVTGPLIIAAEVVEVIDDWASYREEADGLSASAWLGTVFGSWRVQFWRRRHDAMLRLGESVRRTVHHQVAPYVIANVPDDHIDAVKFLLIRACRENHGIPVSYDQAQRRIHKLLGRSKPTSAPGNCGRCAQLEELLRRHGIDVPE